MKRKTIVKAHIIATSIAVLTIGCFFSFSLIAEIIGNQEFIKQVKTGILYCLPVLLFAMPILGITGKKLAGKSQSPIVATKMKRMKFVAFNGIILISLAIYLYFRAINNNIDSTFLYVQIIELLFGAINLTLIGLNIKAGMKLSGRIKINTAHNMV
ncbi:hypothetical protein [Pareuzebyella sediminis]|uniref:hypothetical protein n=1 Tax=Pareuzebyella sediminis TaxID=2607998 RepID=UPI0011EFEF98|nr:hypothetical protein [Pareuzebyella sediminis]